MFKLQPVILCGGSGQRLWPVSTFEMPKQFITIPGRGTLLEQTLERIKTIKHEKYEICESILIMNRSHKLPTELSHIVSESNIIYENFSNDTGVAVARASLNIKNRYPNQETIMLVLPSDHYIYNIENFISDIISGIDQVTDTNIVLYGLQPTRPDTGYGYITPNIEGVKFNEKPNSETANILIAEGALWNSGLFVAKVDLVIECLNKYKYNIMDWVYNEREGKPPSFDIAVLQEHKDIYAHSCSGWRWSDVGCWTPFIEIPEIKDELGNNTKIIDSQNVNVLNRNDSNIVVLGCDNLLVVTSGSNILIMPNTDKYNNQLKSIASIFSN